MQITLVLEWCWPKQWLGIWRFSWWFSYIVIPIGFTLRATSHMTQEPWPCNSEDPWFSSKGHIMGVGNVVLCSDGSSSIVWSENGPCCRTIGYFVGRKERRIWFNLICLKLHQFERNTWRCLSIMEFVVEFALQSVLKSTLLEKNIKNKSWSPWICVRPTS